MDGVGRSNQGRNGALSPAGAPQQHQQQVPRSWTALECALYAANVVLGQGSGGGVGNGGGSGSAGGGGGGRGRKEPVCQQAVQLLVEVCAACLAHGPGE
jgi:hypothetical protein